jgi:hypothetical protein
MTEVLSSWQNLPKDVIDRNNTKENASRIIHHYQVNDKVPYKNVMDSKFSEGPWKGPYTIKK